MLPHKKTIRTSRSREDYDLFKIVLPSFNPQRIKNVTINLQSGDYLHPEQTFGVIYYHKAQFSSQNEQPKAEENGAQEKLSTHVAGTIERVGSSFQAVEGGWRLPQGIKRGSLELLWVRQCKHELQNQSIENSNNKGNFNLPAGQICPLCQKQIWIYASPAQETITSDKLISMNDGFSLEDFQELQWSISLNQPFTPSTSIARVSQRQINFKFLAKASYLIGSGERPSYNTPVMKIKRLYCQHQKIYEKRCQYCLQQIEINQVQQFCRYLFQIGSKQTERSLTKGAALARQQQQYISKLISHNKLILILDLDNTILHSNEMSDLDLGQLLKLRQYFIIQKLEQDIEGKILKDFVLVKIRSFFKEFLFIIDKLFEVYIYTKGTRIYADQICKLVRAQWAGDPYPYFSTWIEPPQPFLKNSQCFLPYRVVSRNEDMSLDTKSMQNILPNRTQYHVILDDRRDVWNNSPSWYYTRDYTYFEKKQKIPGAVQDVSNFIETEQNDPPFKEKLVECFNLMRTFYQQKSEVKIQFSQKDDYFLLFTAHTFKRMHSYFFELLKKSKEGKLDSTAKNKDHPVSLSNIMQRLKLFFAKKKIRFFMPGGNHSFQSISLARRAMKMGATILKQSDPDTPDYVIRGNYYIKFAKNNRDLKRFNLEQQSMKEQDSTNKNIVKSVPQKNQEKSEPQKKQQKMDIETPQSEKKIEQKQIPENENKEAVKQQQKQSTTRTYQQQLQIFTKLVDSKIPIISQTWIIACYEYSYKFRSEDFRLKDPLKQEVKNSDFHESIVRIAEKIRKEINDQMEQQGFTNMSDEKKEKQQKNIQITQVSKKEGQKSQDSSLKKEEGAKKEKQLKT